MGRVAVPLFQQGIGLSQHQVGVWGRHVVKDYGDLPFTGAAADIGAGGDIPDGLRIVKPSGEVLLVLRGHHEHLAEGGGPQGDSSVPGHMEGADLRTVVKAARPLAAGSLAVPEEGYIAFDQQKGALFVGEKIPFPPPAARR